MVAVLSIFWLLRKKAPTQKSSRN